MLSNRINDGQIRVKSTKICAEKIKNLFYEIEDCLDTLVDLDILKETILCSKCRSQSKLTRYNSRKSVKGVYRCCNYRCSTRIRINKGSKIELSIFCDLIFSLLTRSSYFQIRSRLGISASTLSMTKKRLREYFEICNNSKLFIGGTGRIV
ncbi:hypothetical protein DMUE_2734 [Dictyocoela muelleri]|nr:hypothetical protein DMUE_2734 [Dictyocoela muelleri]